MSGLAIGQGLGGGLRRPRAHRKVEALFSDITQLVPGANDEAVLTRSELQDFQGNAGLRQHQGLTVQQHFQLEVAALAAHVNAQVHVAIDRRSGRQVFKFDFQRQARDFEFQRVRLYLAAGAAHADVQTGRAGHKFRGMK